MLQPSRALLIVIDPYCPMDCKKTLWDSLKTYIFVPDALQNDIGSCFAPANFVFGFREIRTLPFSVLIPDTEGCDPTTDAFLIEKSLLGRTHTLPEVRACPCRRHVYTASESDGGAFPTPWFLVRNLEVFQFFRAASPSLFVFLQYNGRYHCCSVILFLCAQQFSIERYLFSQALNQVNRAFAMSIRLGFACMSHEILQILLVSLCQSYNEGLIGAAHQCAEMSRKSITSDTSGCVLLRLCL